MNRDDTLQQNKLSFFLKRFLLFFLFLLSVTPVIAQANHKAAQWQSAGGKKILSGNHNFTISWASDAYSRQDNNKWWPGGFWDAGDTRKYTPWGDTVLNSVAPVKGQITVQGPGTVGLFQKGKGARIYMKNSATKAEFAPWTNTIERKNDKWVGTVKDYNVQGEVWGSVPAGTEITLDISAAMSMYNNQGGTGEMSFKAPQEIEYEIWFFPREGGKVIAKSSGQNNKSPDREETQKCEGKYLEEMKKKVAKLEPGIYILCTEGDDIEVDRKGNGDFEEANELIEKEGFVKLTENGKVITGENSNIVMSFGKRGIVKVKSLTNFSIDRYITSDEGITVNTSMKVGEVNVKVDRRYREVDFSVSSPTCIAGVRGTEFSMSHEETPMKTAITVFSGEVEIQPTICSDPPILLYSGQSITVDNNCFGNIGSGTSTDTDPLGAIADGVAVHRWWHSRDQDWISLAEGEISDSQMKSWGYTKKQFQFYGTKNRSSDGVAVHRWWHSRDKDWISLAEGEISDSQMKSWGYTKKQFQFYTWKNTLSGQGSSNTGLNQSDFNLGSVWEVVESCGGDKWIGTWTQRPGTQTFNATWKKVSGSQIGNVITDVIDFKGIENGIVTLYRHGTSGTYTGKISPGGQNVRDGDASWYNGRCNWAAEIVNGTSNANNGDTATWNASKTVSFQSPDQFEEKLPPAKITITDFNSYGVYPEKGILRGNLYIFKHRNGTSSEYEIKRFDKSGVHISRADIKGQTAGIRGEYIGKLTGSKTAEGTATWTWIKWGEPLKGTWKANW